MLKTIEDPSIVVKDITEWIKNMMDEFKAENVVVDVNGDFISTVNTKLLLNALGESHVYCTVNANLISDRLLDIKRELGIKLWRKVDYTLPEYASEAAVIIGSGRETLKPNTRADLLSRSRVAVQFAISDEIEKSIVVSNLNFSDVSVGNFTLWGDSGFIAPLGKFTRSEVVQLGKALGISDSFLEHDSAEKRMETKIGFPYEAIDAYIRNNEESLPEGVKMAITDRIEKAKIKKRLCNIPMYTPILKFNKAISDNQENA